MASTAVSIRMDADLKREMDEVSRSIGLTTAACFNVFAKQFVAHRGFPFAVVEPVSGKVVSTEKEYAAQMDHIFREMLEGSAAAHELIEDANA